MSFVINNIDFLYLSKEPSFRADANFIFHDILVSNDVYYRFDELFEIVSEDDISLDSLGIFQYAEIGDVTHTEDVYPVCLDVDERNELNENYFKKIENGDIIKVKKNDILISKVRPYLKKILFIDETNEGIYYTSAFIHLRPLKNPRILYYLLKGHFINYLNSISRQGKGYPTLSERDLHLLKFKKNDVDSVFSREAELTTKIISLEEEIKELKKNRISEINIINEAFRNYFHWDYKLFSENKTIKIFNIQQSSVANNYDLRVSAKFHRPAGFFVNEEIEKTNCLRVKNFIEEPITLGASVSPTDFDKNGVCYYLSMATIKHHKIELDETQLLSEDYCNNPSNENKRVRKGDIIMSRSGAAIGKFALVEEDINAIHADFTMRIRLHNINLYFAYYYFRTVYFQYLIEVNYKGLQNNNIFPNQIKEFPIPNISLELQSEIVRKITKRIDLEKDREDAILQSRNKIYEILNNVINHNSN